MSSSYDSNSSLRRWELVRSIDRSIHWPLWWSP